MAHDIHINTLTIDDSPEREAGEKELDAKAAYAAPTAAARLVIIRSVCVRVDVIN
jgi:hypothetical protein